MGGHDDDVGERTALMHVLGDERILQLVKQAHQEWLAALDAIQDPIFIHDQECRVMRSNRAYAEYAGMSVKEVIGKFYYEMFPRHDGPLPQCHEQLQHGGTTEDEIQLPDGKVFLSRATSIRDSQGQYLYSLHIMYDITQRKRMEQALREGDERLQLAFSAAHQAWFDLDVLTGAAAVSPEYPGMMGYDPVGFDTSLQHWQENLHPDDAEAVRIAFQNLLSSGGPATMEYRQSTKSGEWKWISLIGKVVGWDEQHRPLRIIGIFTDIAERKQAELALIKSEVRFRSMFESLAEGVLLFGRDGLIQIYNPAAERILGLSSAQLIGSGMSAPGWAIWHENMTSFDVGELPVAKTLGTGESQRNIILGIERSPGMLQWLNVNSAPVLDVNTRVVIAAIVSFEDFTERKRNEQKLTKFNHALKIIGECNHTLVFAVEEMSLLRDMCRVVVETGGFPAAWVGYVEQDAEQTIRPVGQFGFEEGVLEALTFANEEQGQWSAVRAIRSGQMQVVQNLGNSTCPDERQWAVHQGLASCIVLILKAGAQTLGTLNIYAREADAFNEDEVRLLQELADDLAFGIATMRLRREQERIFEQLSKELEGTVQAVSSMVEMRDPYTAGHERRVADLAVAIAGELGLPQEQVRGIYLAGIIHDLGKIQVPAEILSKPGPLTDVEFNLIKQHPQTGYEILKNIEFPWPIAQMILQHHERLDGSGYPLGLKGEGILFEARLLAVSDVVEAMASHRPYRPGLGLVAALDEIRKNRGRYYEPAVVDACVRLFQEKGYILPEVWGKHSNA